MHPTGIAPRSQSANDQERQRRQADDHIAAEEDRAEPAGQWEVHGQVAREGGWAWGSHHDLHNGHGRADVSACSELGPHGVQAYCQVMTTSTLPGEPVDVGTDIVTAFQRLLQRLRAEVEGLDQELLAWRPAADTTPISNLVLHVIGAVRVHFSVLAGSPRERDREAEFEAAALSASELVERLDAVERELEHYRQMLSEADLLAWRERPARGLTASGLVVLLMAYGHVTEHLAQVSLTRQLHDSSRGRG